MLDSLLQYIAPHSCCGCGKKGGLLCEQCKYDIVFEPYSQCIHCNAPTSSANVCRGCRKKLNIEDVWVVGRRDDVLKALLDRYKFSASRSAGAVCADLLVERLPILPADITIVPVPTSAHSRRVRGFGHTELVAKQLARRLRCSYASPLTRKATGTQHFRSRADRLKLSADDFDYRGGAVSPVLLVDDIYTTGATLRACVQKLRENGVKVVYVAIVARQPLDV